MVILFFKIWPFATMKISPIMPQICQSRLTVLPSKILSIKNLPKTRKLLPKWQNFAKSGHTGRDDKKSNYGENEINFCLFCKGVVCPVC